MDKLIVPANGLINGERVSRPLAAKINELVDWINETNDEVRELVKELRKVKRKKESKKSS